MRDYIDFHYIEPKHDAIHTRLVNWARWCYGTGGRFEAGPMFVGVKTTDVWEQSHAPIPVDELGAIAMEKAVRYLPADNRAAVRWWYVYQSPPMAMCRKLACPAATLQRLVRDGRQMLVNRAT